MLMLQTNKQNKNDVFFISCTRLEQKRGLNNGFPSHHDNDVLLFTYRSHVTFSFVFF